VSKISKGSRRSSKTATVMTWSAKAPHDRPISWARALFLRWFNSAFSLYGHPLFKKKEKKILCLGCWHFARQPARQIEVNHCPSWLITAIYILYGAIAPINNPTPNAKGLWSILYGPAASSSLGRPCSLPSVPDLPSLYKKRRGKKIGEARARAIQPDLYRNGWCFSLCLARDGRAWWMVKTT